MPIVPVRIPQMGEGLQEALLVQFIKQPGDHVERDDALYVMETDKASTEIESPYSGTLVRWLVQEGSVLAIGTEVAEMEVKTPLAATESHSSATNTHEPIDGSALDSDSRLPTKTQSNTPFIPPRTKQYLKEKGLLEKASSIPVAGNKMMPEDVDRFLASQSKSTSQPASLAQPFEAFEDTPIPKTQISLNFRMEQSRDRTIPVCIMSEVDWSNIEKAKLLIQSQGRKTSGFGLFLLCVVNALQKHPKFRTSILPDGKTFRTFRGVHVGIAVSVEEDGLVMAVIRNADKLDRPNFLQTLAEQISKARKGEDQADASVPMSVSNIGSAGIRFGIPTVVAPQVATLALGEVFDAPVPSANGFEFQKRAQVTLAFDHRIVNGVGAAAFLNDLRREIESFSW